MAELNAEIERKSAEVAMGRSVGEYQPDGVIQPTWGADFMLDGWMLGSLEGRLPETVAGDLSLRQNGLVSLDGLPKTIGGALYLYDIPAKSLPAGTSVQYGIYIHSWQVELIRDAKAKGYAVHVAEGQAI